MHVHAVPGKLVVRWNERAKAIIDTWENYTISLEEFREAVLEKGLAHARAHGGVAWIVDSSTAKGAFSQEIQAFIGTDVFPAFSRAGIQYFITVMSKSALTALTVKSYQAKTGPNGLILVEIGSVEEAIVYLADHRKSA